MASVTGLIAAMTTSLATTACGTRLRKAESSGRSDAPSGNRHVGDLDARIERLGQQVRAVEQHQSVEP